MKWKPISQLPKKDAPFLIYAPSCDPKKPLIHIAWFEPKAKCWSLLPEMWLKGITHWMPLPKGPK